MAYRRNVYGDRDCLTLLMNNFRSPIANCDFQHNALALMFVSLLILWPCGDGAHAEAAIKQEAEILTPKQNFATALKKAEAGDVVAQTDVGAMYGTGIGVAKNFTKAVQWWRKAADKGHAGAQ